MGSEMCIRDSTSSVNIVGEELSSSTIISTQLSADSTPFETNLTPEQRQDIRTLQRMTQRLMTIYKLSDLLRSATTQDEILSNVMNLIFDVLPADRGVIMLLEPGGGELEPQIVRFRDDAPNQELNISRTIVQKCLNERVAVLSRDAKIDSRFNSSESIMASDIRSAMCIPLVSKKNLVGILFLDTKESVRAFTEDDLTFAASLGNEVAMTLDNLLLTQENIKGERLAAVGQTVAGLAHNIKNILQLARGGLELMDTAIKRQAMSDMETFWPIVRRGIDRMQELTQEMLDYSRQTAPDLVEADPNVVVRELTETFKSDRVEPGIEIALELASGLPPRKIDPDGLNKAMMNLLSNAVDAFDGAGGRIVLSTLCRGDNIMIKVADNGKGIPKDKQNKIFQPFFTTKGSKGTGLGLSMTRKYIEDMGGTISVESEEGRGTIFTIVLPPSYSQLRFDTDKDQPSAANAGTAARNAAAKSVLR